MTQPRIAVEIDAPPRLAFAGVVMLLMVLCLRVLVSYDPTPGWGGDPLELESPIVGLTPLGSLMVDGVTLLASAGVLLGMAKRGQTPPLWQTLCLAAGGVVIALHGRILKDASVTNLVVGSSWFAAYAGAFAAAQAAREPQLRRLMVGASLGLIAPLVVKGAVQCFIEQPDSLKEFLEHKERYLSANGWTTGSPMALAYERRLEQPEATGWFGMANVFATVAATSLTALAGFLISEVRTSPSSNRVQNIAFLLFGVAASAAGVYLAGSKGGYAAAALGLVLTAVVQFLDRRSSTSAGFTSSGRPRVPLVIGSAVAVFFPALALLSIVVRGLVGTRIHELSLLFRWFYIQAAARIFSEHPLLGTGPEGFKDAYMLVKPAISPEDISSPHSIFFDMSARLGLGGVALSSLLIAWLWHTGRGLIQTSDHPAAPAIRTGGQATSGTSTRSEARILLITIGIATAAGAILEQQAATITSSLVRAGGIAGFMLIGLAVLRVMSDGSALRRYLNPAIAIAAIAGFTHAQIELTGIMPGANLWLFLLLAVGCTQDGPTARAASRVRGLVAPVLLLAAAVLFVPFAVVPVARWDLTLRDASRQLQDIPSFAARAEAIVHGKPLPRDTPRSLASDLAAALGPNRGVNEDRASLIRAVNDLRFARMMSAYEELYPIIVQGERNDSPTAKQWPRPGQHWIPPDFDSMRSFSRLSMQIAGAEYAGGEEAPGANLANVATSIAWGFAEERSSPQPFAWWGTLERNLAELETRQRDFHLSQAVVAFEKAAALAPHEPLYAAQLARINTLLSRREEAAKWARQALETNQDLYLDPLRQFNKVDLAELTALATAGETPSTPPSSPP